MLWISHRGLTEDAVENTARAFQAARSGGFRAIETDIQPTADGNFVCFHDLNLKRLFGKNLATSSLSTADWKNLRYADGSQPVFLLDLVREYPEIFWTWDLKGPDPLATVKAFQSFCDRNKLGPFIEKSVRFVAWSQSQERFLRKAFPHSDVYARIDECRRAALSLKLGLTFLSGINVRKIYSLPPRAYGINFYTDQVISRYRDLGVRLLAFLPQRKADLEFVLSKGFEEILLNGRIPDHTFYLSQRY